MVILLISGWMVVVLHPPAARERKICTCNFEPPGREVSQCKQLLYAQKKLAKILSLLRSLTLFELEWRRRFKECPICFDVVDLLASGVWESPTSFYNSVVKHLFRSCGGSSREKHVSKKREYSEEIPKLLSPALNGKWTAFLLRFSTERNHIWKKDIWSVI